MAVSCREAVASAGGVGACKRLLEASMRGGRSREERRLRCEALAALGALGATSEGPRLLRETGVVRLLSIIIGGPSRLEFSACSRYWAGLDEGSGGAYPFEAGRVLTRGLRGGTREDHLEGEAQ